MCPQGLRLESSFASELPGDPSLKNRRRQVLPSFFVLLKGGLCLYFWVRAPQCIRPLTDVMHLQVEGAFYSYASPTANNTEPYIVAYSAGKLSKSSAGLALCAAALDADPCALCPMPALHRHLLRPNATSSLTSWIPVLPRLTAFICKGGTDDWLGSRGVQAARLCGCLLRKCTHAAGRPTLCPELWRPSLWHGTASSVHIAQTDHQLVHMQISCLVAIQMPTDNPELPAQSCSV